ncbi:MAG: phytoene/squalene synthase family protein [Oceanospirillales bacterium]|nr:MAG: phytoene/squalene synthase family protein [Oceanospirillales bacterium]
MSVNKDVLKVLKDTSRTFYIPISRLPSGLQEAVTSAYLCMRAIDEIEDHPDLENQVKAKILRDISLSLQAGHQDTTQEAMIAVFESYEKLIPEVSYRIGEWALLAPSSIRGRIWDSTAAMADRMAYWSEKNWTIETQSNLDQYTFSVAGAVGLLLSDLWAWYDNTQTNREEAIGFGRGLQAINILRNHREDKVRGVSFFPEGWQLEDMHDYARYNLALGYAYTKSLPKGPAQQFCQIPLTLADATLKALTLGKPKLSRDDVLKLVAKVSR